MKRCFPCYLALALFLILSFHAWASISAAYFTHLWLDIPMHFAGGAWVASAVYYFFFLRDGGYKLSAPLLPGILFVVGAAMIVGVCWEFFEYGMDVIAEKYLDGRAINQMGIKDTMGDLFLDMAGAFMAAIYYLVKRRA